MTGALGSAWKSFWFARRRLHPLGLMRLVLGARALQRYIPNAVERTREDLLMDSGQFFDNVGSTLTAALYPPSESQLSVLTSVLYLAGLLAMLGLFTRTSLAVLGIALLYANSGYDMHAGFNHQTALVIQVFLILAVAPGSKAWSLDRLIDIARFGRRRKGAALQGPSLRRFARHMQGPAVSRWGLQLILALFVVVYTTAGLSKLRFSDGQWYDGQTLAYYLDGTHQGERKISQVFFGDPELAERDAWKDGAGLFDHSYGKYSHRVFANELNHDWVFIGLSIATLLLELSALVVFFGPGIRNLYLLSAMGMHISIGFSMHLSFSEYRLLILLLLSYPLLWRQITWPIRVVRRRGA